MKPKVTHLIAELTPPGGAERQLFLLAKALRDRRWPQSVISFFPGGLWEDRLNEAGIPVCTVPRHRFPLVRLRALRRLVRRQQPQILMSWSANAAVYAHWLRGVGRPKKIYCLRQNPTVNSNSGRANRLGMFRSATLRGSDFVISNTQENLDVLRREGIRLPRTRVVRNIAFPQGRAKPEEPVACPRIVTAGNLKPLKGYHLLLETLGRLASEGMAFELLMAGDGPERPRLERLAADGGFADRARFLGEMDNVLELMRTAHIMVHPSMSEGLSNSIVEAMTEGLAVVASAVGGTPEIVIDDQTGLLVQPGRPEEFVTALGRVLTDPALRGRLGKAALQFVTQHCAENVVVDQYERTFQELLPSMESTVECEK